MPLKRSLLYGLANLAYFLGYSTFNTYALFFYTDHLQAPAALIGRAWLLFGIWNTANDLLCGWLSDRIPHRLGRRTLPILVLSIPVGVSFAFLWNPPGAAVAAGPGALFWYFLLVASLYDVLQTAVSISQAAAFPEITRTSGDRSRVAAIRQAYGFVGTALGVALSPLLYDRLGWGVMGMTWGAILSGLWLLSLPGFKSGSPPPETPPAPDAGWRESLRLIFGRHAFRMFLLIQLATRVALAFVQLAMPFYAAHVLGLSAGQLSAVLGGLLGSALITIPVWPWLLRRLEPRASGILAALYLAGMLVPFLFAGHWAALLVVAALIGPGYAGLTVVLDMLFAQVVDADLVRTGRSRAGLFSGLIGTLLRLAPALAGLLIGEFLALSGYDPALPVQPPLVAMTLRVLVAVVPGVALGLAALALFAYPLHGERLASLEAEVRRHQVEGTGGSETVDEKSENEPG